MDTVGGLGERALIDRIRARVPPPPEWVRIGIGDDAAVLAGERNGLDVVTTDALVEGVHFDRRFVPPRAIGHRALAVNLSDLAAMGARPRAALLSLALPDALGVADFDAILDGLLDVAGRYRVVLVGGNIARSPGPLVVDVTALGSAQPRRVLTRAGARPGDLLMVSGEIGTAAAGLDWCRSRGTEASETAGTMSAAAHRFLFPEPRVRLGWVLARTRAATACVDLSDGLADGVHQMAAASGVGAIVDGDALPVAAATREWLGRSAHDALVAALTGGEDYELLFTVPARRPRLLQAVSRQAGGSGREDGSGTASRAVPLTRIGVITREPRVILRRSGRDEVLPQGFAHFR